MDESPNPGENEEPGARLGRILSSGCKKKAIGGRVEGTAGDAYGQRSFLQKQDFSMLCTKKQIGRNKNLKIKNIS
jgi:hypothetical protein